MDPPLTVDRAIDYVQEWLIQPCVTTVHPTYRHSALLRELLNAVGTAGNRVPDAHLATLAIEHGATLCSADEDFGRFPGLDWRIHYGPDTGVTRPAIPLLHVASVRVPRRCLALLPGHGRVGGYSADERGDDED